MQQHWLKPARYNVGFKVMVFLSAIVLLSGCERKDGPEEVTEKFMNHLMAREYAEAGEYGTESTRQMMQMFVQLENLGGEAIADEEIEPEKIGEITCEMTSDSTAVCLFKEQGEDSELNLVKREGEWKVDMNKEDPFGNINMDESEQENTDNN